MQRLQYFVVHHDNQWKIKSKGNHSTPFKTQMLAITEAINQAHYSSQNGQPSQVIVQGLDNNFRTEWTYGEDPYPPEG
jgi:hypothetical protein